jgi:hypothetical protein
MTLVSNVSVSRPTTESRTHLPVFAKYLGGTILKMKMGAVFRAMFVLAAIPMAGQVTAGIHLVDVRFKGGHAT